MGNNILLSIVSIFIGTPFLVYSVYIINLFYKPCCKKTIMPVEEDHQTEPQEDL